MHLESVVERLQTSNRVAGSACNFWIQERAGGKMTQDLRIGFKTNKTRTNAAVAAAVALIGASLRRNSAANSSPPPCGEGSGVEVARGGIALPQPPDPPPHPSPTRGEGVMVARPLSVVLAPVAFALVGLATGTGAAQAEG